MLEKLISLYGPSGLENNVADFIEKELSSLAEVSRDPMGNVIAHINGSGKKLMLAAHMDEIGVIITFIEDNGFLRFAPVGGLSAAALPYLKVVFPCGRKGVIAYPEKTELKNLKISDMYIDIGVSSKEEALKYVEIGQMATFEPGFYKTEDTVTSGKLDDRVGCYILLELAKRVTNPACDLYLVFTVQEEVGLRGASPSAFSVKPDMAVAVDVTATGDTPGVETMAVKLGGGVAIKVKDGRMVSSPQVRELLEKTAKDSGLPYQFEVLRGGTTDASAIQTALCGIPAGAVSVPTRYIHTPCETASLKDIESIISLLENLVKREELI